MIIPAADPGGPPNAPAAAPEAAPSNIIFPALVLDRSYAAFLRLSIAFARSWALSIPTNFNTSVTKTFAFFFASSFVCAGFVSSGSQSS
jgi:hypothetical protein